MLSPLPPNPIEQALKSGKSVIGTMIVQMRAPAFIQLFASYGLQFFIMDMEHGSYSFETAADLIQVARLAGITPLVRVNEPHYHLISRLLDAGAQGILTPRVETVEKISRPLAASHYPPQGERGFSRLAAHLNYADVDVAAYVEYANQNLVNLIQIETARGVEVIDFYWRYPGSMELSSGWKTWRFLSAWAAIPATPWRSKCSNVSFLPAKNITSPGGCTWQMLNAWKNGSGAACSWSRFHPTSGCFSKCCAATSRCCNQQLPPIRNNLIGSSPIRQSAARWLPGRPGACVSTLRGNR